MPNIGDIERGDRVGYKSNGLNRYIWLSCPDCGIERWVSISRKNRVGIPRCRRCSARINSSKRDFNGPSNYQWKGGRHLVKNKGYIEVWIPSDSPYISMVKGRHGRQSLWEHRLVMAEFLGRPLESWEIVHHLNGIRTDNRIENLALTNRHTHERWTIVKILRQRIISLETTVQQQDKDIKLLRWQIKELLNQHQEV
jgi:hypothetical protein